MTGCKLKLLAMLQGATKEGKLSVRGASMKYGIPRSTIHDHASLKVKKMSNPGPSPVLTSEEERELVQWVIKMVEIDYGQCRQHLTHLPTTCPGKIGSMHF